MSRLLYQLTGNRINTFCGWDLVAAVVSACLLLVFCEFRSTAEAKYQSDAIQFDQIREAWDRQAIAATKVNWVKVEAGSFSAIGLRKGRFMKRMISQGTDFPNRIDIWNQNYLAVVKRKSLDDKWLLDEIILASAPEYNQQVNSKKTELNVLTYLDIENWEDVSPKIQHLDRNGGNNSKIEIIFENISDRLLSARVVVLPELDYRVESIYLDYGVAANVIQPTGWTQVGDAWFATKMRFSIPKEFDPKESSEEISYEFDPDAEPLNTEECYLTYYGLPEPKLPIRPSSIPWFAILLIFGIILVAIGAGVKYKSSGNPSNRRGGFSLVELLVAIGIISILVGLSLPAIQAAREAGRRSQCQNKMRQLGLAMLNYESSHQLFPTGYSTQPGSATPLATWIVPLLPYMEQSSIYDQSRLAYSSVENPFVNPPHTAFGTVMPSLVCPSNPNALLLKYFSGYSGAAATTYLGVMGTTSEAKDGILFDGSKIRLAQVKDGLSNTILIGERPPSADGWFGWWYCGFGQNGTSSLDALMAVRELNLRQRGNAACADGPFAFQAGDEFDQCSSMHFWSLHPGGANFVIADGSVVFQNYDVDAILPDLATRSGGEIVERFR